MNIVKFILPGIVFGIVGILLLIGVRVERFRFSTRDGRRVAAISQLMVGIAFIYVGTGLLMLAHDRNILSVKLLLLLAGIAIAAGLCKDLKDTWRERRTSTNRK